ncbi:hypothetical protein GDO78_020525 [Eleutherodactylus coqui]|uniref:Uncharacterized protein n=1 Tax=Eleutherodactylus coqui TaxID=57060 RepID=A0A8J6BBE0_ELECQ|nr:hypothetical protein GDO78_020525 [Eleutherodactylus coqui]
MTTDPRRLGHLVDAVINAIIEIALAKKKYIVILMAPSCQCARDVLTESLIHSQGHILGIFCNTWDCTSVPAVGRSYIELQYQKQPLLKGTNHQFLAI